jgi:putative DNA primase/helicase
VNGDYPRSDAGNAERLVDVHGHELLHAHGLGWHVFDGRRFRPDTDGELMRRMRAVARAVLEEALALDVDDRKAAVSFALQSENQRRLEAALLLARVDERVIAHADQLDADPLLLVVGNGVLDLDIRRGGPQLRAGRREDLATRATAVAYDPRAQAPTWHRVLHEVFAGDLELIGAVQRLYGYLLTGATSEQVVTFFYGAGANGKSVLLGVLRELGGDYAAQAAIDTFLGGRDKSHDLARFRGVRILIASESAQGRLFDETLVKQATGGERIVARALYQDPFEYRPTFKPVIATNHMPRVRDGDPALLRRIRVIPFTVSFEGREDRELPAKLQAELPGILAWAVEGCAAWQRDGLGTAAAITTATGAYRAEQDPLGAFLSERCTFEPGARTTKLALRTAYEQWARENGESTASTVELGKRLARHGVTVGGKGRSTYLGVALTQGVQDAGGCRQNGKVPHARAGEDFPRVLAPSSTLHPVEAEAAA